MIKPLIGICYRFSHVKSILFCKNLRKPMTAFALLVDQTTVPYAACASVASRLRYGEYARIAIDMIKKSTELTIAP